MNAAEERVLAVLRREKIPFSLIGAVACAVHGMARYSADVDFLVTDTRVLSASLWASDLGADVRVGDTDDPLAGVVRFHLPNEIDLIVGKGYAFTYALTHTVPAEAFPGVPVASALALVLLKLEAGGTKDRYDITALCQAQRALGAGVWIAEIPAEVKNLSRDAQTLWSVLEREVLAA